MNVISLRAVIKQISLFSINRRVSSNFQIFKILICFSSCLLKNFCDRDLYQPRVYYYKDQSRKRLLFQELQKAILLIKCNSFKILILYQHIV
jgi:hypothetical protein